jgi:hypothetical protein
MKDLLIYCKIEKLAHKFKENIKPNHYCYWTTNRQPKRNINRVWFSDGDHIYATGRFLGVEKPPIEQPDNTLWLKFEPLTRVTLKEPVDPPIRGWKYIDVLLPNERENNELCKTL